MPDPGVHPRDEPRSTTSDAERRVHAALRDQLPPGWYAWHSLRLRSSDGWLGEGDFVLAHRSRGLLVLEVKGGAVSQRDGVWFQNGARMAKGPLEQAHRFARMLLDRLREEGCEPPAWGVAVAFPDVAHGTGPTQDDLAGVTLDGEGLRWLAQALPALADRALPHPRTPRGNWIDRIHTLWGDTWVPGLTLGLRVHQGADARVRLDADQLEQLDRIADNRRLLVQGPAGSGKTLLAREAAVRAAAAGRRVLVLTFTDALAHWLAESVAGTTVRVAPIRRFALDVIARAGLPPPAPVTPEEWDRVSADAADVVAETDLADWDLVVVDEAQDLTEHDWLLVDQLAGDGPLWAFEDPAQRYWPDRVVPASLLQATYRLTRPYRCAPGIMALAHGYDGVGLDEAAVRAALAAETIRIVACPSPGQVAVRLAREIDRLLAAGLRPGDIAVVSLRGRTAESAVLEHPRLGAHEVVPADASDIADRVVVDTFLRFKGLERPAVIVTDLGGVARRKHAVRMHIALTRALDLVRLVAEASAIADDPVLARFASSAG